MFRKIGEEKAFDAILNQIIDNIQDGNIKGYLYFNGEDEEVFTLQNTKTSGPAVAKAVAEAAKKTGVARL